MRHLLLFVLLCFTTNVTVAQTFGTESLTFTNNSGPYDMQNGNGTVNLTCGTVDELNIPLTVTNIGILGAGSPSPAIESVTLNITHIYNSDVRLSLTDPSGMVTLDLINSGVGGFGDNFTNCTIIDGGGVFPTINTNSITGNYAPHGTGGFASFNIPATILADGDWTLNVCDAGDGDVGTIDDWSITFTIPTVYVPDDNFEQALIDLGYDSGPLDDYVPFSIINTITTLDVSNKNISDLTGIEAFTALESLVVHSNQLSTLNVTQNSLLTNLNCENNLLTSIDLTQNTALISVSVAANQLTRLDLSQNLNLETLICSANQISYLDVQVNIALTQFIAASNALRILNVKNGNNANFTQFFINNNPELTCVEVDSALYSTFNWFNIDAGVSFSGGCLTYVPDDNFEAYLEANNLGNGIANDDYVLTTSVTNALNLEPNNKNISDLTGIEDFLNLSFLSLNDNNLTSIDVSHNSMLTDLSLYNNNLTSLDVSNNTMLIYLYCDSNALTILDFSNNTKLQTLNCSNNDLAVLNMKNGANHLILPEDPLYPDPFFISYGNPNLTCITVDNEAYSNANWLYKDAHTSFSETTCTRFVPDDNFEQALIDLGYDTVLDDQVEAANIFLVTSLDVNNKGILDLTGIEGFVSLTNLNCSANNLEILNLNNNTKLNSLNASNNELHFFTFKNGNNQLINNSADFNTIGNPNLSCIQVDNAAYSTTNWTTIDSGVSFSQLCLTYVPDDNFEAYLEANNLGNGIANDDYIPTASIINTLDLYLNNKNISDLTGIEDFLNLSVLSLYDNNLTSLDVSNNLNLTYLQCSSNALTSLDVSNNTKLEVLLCSNNNLSVLNMKNGANHLILPEDLSYFDVFFDSYGNPNLTCVTVDNEAYSYANWLYKDAHTSFNEVSCQTVEIEPKIYLQGASLEPNTGEETLMRDNLRVANLVPTTSPYEDGLTTTNAVFTVTGNNAIVDWVWLELRDENDLTRIITSQSALLQRDGDVVATDGVSTLSFAADHTNYHVVLKHRNHLGIMTQNTVALSDVATSVDFTNAATQITYGTNAQTTFGMPTGIIAMWTGNANGDVAVQYSGTNPDTPSILSKVLNDAGNFLSFPTYIANGYDVFDINMDGNTQYSGTNPDTPFILQNVLAHPSNFLNFSTFQIQEQLPEN